MACDKICFLMLARSQRGTVGSSFLPFAVSPGLLSYGHTHPQSVFLWCAFLIL